MSDSNKDDYEKWFYQGCLNCLCHWRTLWPTIRCLRCPAGEEKLQIIGEQLGNNWPPRSAIANRIPGLAKQTATLQVQIHDELFEERTKVHTYLRNLNIEWLSDYSFLDLDHANYGIEVGGIRNEAVSKKVEAILKRLYPDWNRVLRYCSDCTNEGWKVQISKFGERS